MKETEEEQEDTGGQPEQENPLLVRIKRLEKDVTLYRTIAIFFYGLLIGVLLVGVFTDE